MKHPPNREVPPTEASRWLCVWSGICVVGACGIHEQSGCPANTCESDDVKLQAGAIGAVVARFVHTEEVTGSNPVSPTIKPVAAQRV